jgi:hypothetical protein
LWKPLLAPLNYVEVRAAMHPTWCMAEGVGFEPTSPLGETVFKTAAIDHSAIPPPKHERGHASIASWVTVHFALHWRAIASYAAWAFRLWILATPPR